jgi:hypothetical protein
MSPAHSGSKADKPAGLFRHFGIFCQGFIDKIDYNVILAKIY